MRILIADDDFVNRRFLERILICLDIMMTRLDGYKTLEAIREAENKYAVLEEERAKVIMISALDEVVLDSIQVCDDYDAYICKPIVVDKFEQLLEKMGFHKMA